MYPNPTAALKDIPVNTWRNSISSANLQQPAQASVSRTGNTTSPTNTPPLYQNIEISGSHKKGKDAQPQRQMRPHIPSFSRAGTRIGEDDDNNNDDTSVWSDDDRGSVVSLVSALGTHSNGGFDCGESVMSNVETLVGFALYLLSSHFSSSRRLTGALF